METVALSADQFLFTLALISVVIIVSALLSGVVEKSGVSHVAVFLLIAAVIGPGGLRLVDITVASPILRAVATLSLALVLFTDAVSLKMSEVRRNGRLAFVVLGPGTLLSAACVSLSAWYFLRLPPAACAILGAALSSTDPVLLRGLLRRRDLNGSVRQALRLESGLNDGVLLPIILGAMVFLGAAHEGGRADWVRLGMTTLLLGPAAGVVIGLVSVAALDLIRRRTGVRRDYESLYSLGVAFAAFAAAESLHGSGFLAAFAAGLTISALDVELCDCFLEYGETTAEMALLFTFVLFGTSMIWSGLTIITLPTLGFAVATLCARPLAFLPALNLSRVGLSPGDRRLVAWFGPRGLSSLLLVLLPVFAGIPGTESLVPICCLVVLLSVVVHGVLPAFVKQGGGTQPEPISGAARLTVTPDSVPIPSTPSVKIVDPKRITIEEVRTLESQAIRFYVLDVRNDRSYNDSDRTIAESIRVESQMVSRRAGEMKIPKDAYVITFCSCPADASAIAAATDLQSAGWTNARALHGGWEAWLGAGMRTERK